MTYAISGTPITLLCYLNYTASGGNLPRMIFSIFSKYSYVYCFPTQQNFENSLEELAVSHTWRYGCKEFKGGAAGEDKS
jgi:hypothetical protein